MSRRNSLHVFCLVVFLLLSNNALAGNWPQWRGPQLNGTSDERNLPLKWGAAENLSWKLPLPGLSGATPIVWGERIFLNVAEGEQLFLWCVERNKGTLAWKRLLGGGNHKERKHNMSSPSPVTDGKSVYVMTGTGILKGFDFQGKELWARDIQKDYGTFGLQWGYASSPLLHEDSLYVQVLHGMKTDEPSYVLRINKTTGKTVWKVERPTNAIMESPDAYTTPALLRYAGAKTEIVITGGDVVTGHDLQTGKELWRAGGLNPENAPFYRIVASPVIYDGIIYAPTRVKPLLAFRAGAATSQRRTCSGLRPSAPTCRRPSRTENISTSSATKGSSGVSTRRRGRKSTAPSASSPAPIPLRPSWPTGKFTRRARKA